MCTGLWFSNSCVKLQLPKGNLFVFVLVLVLVFATQWFPALIPDHACSSVGAPAENARQAAFAGAYPAAVSSGICTLGACLFTPGNRKPKNTQCPSPVTLLFDKKIVYSWHSGSVCCNPLLNFRQLFVPRRVYYSGRA